jgi:hypothetical protein
LNENVSADNAPRKTGGREESGGRGKGKEEKRVVEGKGKGETTNIRDVADSVDQA